MFLGNLALIQNNFETKQYFLKFQKSVKEKTIDKILENTKRKRRAAYYS